MTQGLSNILTFGLINPRQLARETVYSWYRIKMVDIDGTGRLPLIPGWQGGANGTGGPGRIEALWQILPLIEHQVRGYFDVAGKFVPFPVWVWGVFYDDQMAFGNTQPGSFYHADFTVDVEQGLVKFSNLTMLLNPDGSWAPAKLAMRCSVRVRDYDARFIERYERSLLLTPTGGTHDTGPKVIKREEIVLYTLPIYNDAHAVTQLLSNGVQANQEADYNLTVAAADFNTVTPQDVTYMGLKDISPDGAITQATVDVSPGGTTTRAARNTEWHPAVPSYRERRQMELLQAGLPVVQQLQDQSRKG